MRKIIVSPSLLSADFKNLEKDILAVQNGGAQWLHFDVMDGHFVPNISFGVPVLKSIAGTHNMKNDVHIMVSDPLFYGPLFAEAGADLVTFHYEADPEHIDEIIEAIKNTNCQVGISIKPSTSASVVLPYLAKLDLVLIMSVEPGFGGQSFMSNSLEKIAILRSYIDEHHLSTVIEVDGGINEQSGRLCKEAGVDILVAGSYLFGKKDVAKRINTLKGEDK